MLHDRNIASVVVVVVVVVVVSLIPVVELSAHPDKPIKLCLGE